MIGRSSGSIVLSRRNHCGILWLEEVPDATWPSCSPLRRGPGLSKSPEKHFWSHSCHLHLSPCPDAQHPCPAHWQWLNLPFSREERTWISRQVKSFPQHHCWLATAGQRPKHTNRYWPGHTGQQNFDSCPLQQPVQEVPSHSDWPTSQSDGPDGQDTISKGQPLYCLSWFPTQSNWIQQEHFPERPIKYLKGISHQDSCPLHSNATLNCSPVGTV